MRGKVRRILRPRNSVGITPAYAGKRLAFLQFLFFLRDHPRICGEKLGLFTVQRDLIGSPPHMRGKADAEAGIAEFFGITPAYAGKSRIHGQTATAARDHPRICGEKCHIYKVLDLLLGITPAYAGKRRRWLLIRCWHRDHPRICGEKFLHTFAVVAGQGSPPHMRGKVH